ncbi:MAG TPA: hypothetical protein VIL97_02705 [Thermoanaerobaculia bacterium]
MTKKLGDFAGCAELIEDAGIGLAPLLGHRRGGGKNDQTRLGGPRRLDEVLENGPTLDFVLGAADCDDTPTAMHGFS